MRVNTWIWLLGAVAFTSCTTQNKGPGGAVIDTTVNDGWGSSGGGMGSSGSGSAGCITSNCATCAVQKCKSQDVTCAEDPDCDMFANCQCNSCQPASASAQSEWNALNQCLAAMCSTDCSTGSAGSSDDGGTQEGGSDGGSE